MSRRMAAALATVAVICLGPGVGAAAPPAGEVLALNGQCMVAAGVPPVALKQGDAIHVGDSVTCPAGAKAKLRMSDGSVISVAPGSRLTVATYDTGGGHRDARLTLAAGLLRAVVAAVGGPSHFEVDTATGVAAVRSTDWFIEAKPGVTQVGVLAGIVTLTSAATGHSVDIPARQGARVNKGKDPARPRVWRKAQFANVIARTTLK